MVDQISVPPSRPVADCTTSLEFSAAKVKTRRSSWRPLFLTAKVVSSNDANVVVNHQCS